MTSFMPVVESPGDQVADGTQRGSQLHSRREIGFHPGLQTALCAQGANMLQGGRLGEDSQHPQHPLVPDAI